MTTELTKAEMEEEREAILQQRVAEFRRRQAATESGQDFVIRHGGDYVSLGGWLYFVDGARCDLHVFVRYEPPDDPRALLKARRIWLAEKVVRARTEFGQYKQSVLDADSMARRYANYLGAPAEAPYVLRQLKKVANDLEARLAEIDRQLAPPPEAVRQRDEARQSHAMAAHKLINTVKGIKL